MFPSNFQITEVIIRLVACTTDHKPCFEMTRKKQTQSNEELSIIIQCKDVETRDRCVGTIKEAMLMFFY